MRGASILGGCGKLQLSPSSMTREASLDDCLKLLKADSDEQRLVGLLLATKFVKGDDYDAVRKVFDATGFQFINQLIENGNVKLGKGKDRPQSNLHLALSILVAFCHVPELASKKEILSKVPVLLTTIASKQDEAVSEDCYECLFSIAVSSETGLHALLDLRALSVVAHNLQDSAPDAPWIQVALKLMFSLLAKIVADNKVAEHAQGLIYVVPPLAKHLAFQQDSTKFEVLSILYSLLVSDISRPIRIALRDSAHQSQWPVHARTGIGHILHSRVAVEQKYLALELADSIVELVGDTWLVGFMEFPGQQGRAPPNRFFLLIVETLRVETTVLVNEVAQTAFGSGEELDANTSTSETGAWKQRRLIKCFALLECVINVMVTQDERGKVMDEAILQNTIIALDEVVGVVLDLLEDAQGHNLSRGDILLASVRIVSRYLTESPSAHRKRCLSLLPFLLSISTESEHRPFLAVQFMLPILTQVTVDLDGCKALLACRGHIQIVTFLSWAVQRSNETKSSMVDVCDVLLNLLMKKDQLLDVVNVGHFIPILPALVAWVGQGLTKMETAMAASVCTSVLNLTTENVMGPCLLHHVYQVIILNVEQCLKGKRIEGLADDEDLLEIILSGSRACLDRYPSFKQALRAWVRHLAGNRPLSSIQNVAASPSLRQLLAMVVVD